jgi:DNA uptake protein ComE-like DNA-binding protein
MQTNNDPSSTQAARLGPNHGYAINGDVALLNAEVKVPRDAGSRGEQWALQLWACDAPHAGGPLRGVKVAEAAVSVAPSTAGSAEPAQLAAESKAQVPGGLRDYSMVLVLASGTKGSFDQVHDFANYPDRQRFIAPHLEGAVGYRVEGTEVVLRAERVRSPRLQGNLSGSLRLELWALAESYRGGPLAGTALAAVDIGRLGGQNTFESIDERVAFKGLAAGQWQMVLTLREWVDALGFVTRDYCNFAVPYVVGAPKVTEPARSPVAAALVPAVTPVKAAAPVSVPAVTPVKAAVPVSVPAVTPVKAAAPVSVPAAATVKAAPPVSVEPVVSAKPVALPAVAATSAKVAATPAIITASSVQRVSIMRATVEELARVPGIDSKLAARIVGSRPYKSVDELAKVRGIGAKLLASLRKALTV